MSICNGNKSARLITFYTYYPYHLKGNYSVTNVLQLGDYTATRRLIKEKSLSKVLNCTTEMVSSTSSETQKFSRETRKPHVPIHLDT